MAKKALSLVLFLLILFTALSGSFTVSAVYDNTHTNTGNGRNDIVEIAKTQIGYYEGIEQYAGYTKYGYWYHQYMNVESAFITAAWCAMFVSWCSYQAGTIEKTGSFAYTPYWVNYFKNLRQWQSRTSGYFPKAGDIIFFTDNGSLASHVGIVYEVNSSTVFTIEGNTADACLYRSYSPSDTYILGYGTPDYSGEGTVVGELWSTTAAGGLNLRSGAGTGYGILASIPNGTKIVVTEKVQTDGIIWGKTLYNGYEGYCALSYASYIGDAIVPEPEQPPALPVPVAGERVYITGCNTPITAGAAVVINKSFNGTNTVAYNQLVISWAAYLVAAPTSESGVYVITLKGEHLQSGSLTVPEGGIIFASHCDDRNPGSEVFINSRDNKIATNGFLVGDRIVIKGVNFSSGAVGATAVLEKVPQSGTNELELINGSFYSVDAMKDFLLGVRAGDSLEDIRTQFVNSGIMFDKTSAGTGCKVYYGEESLTLVILGDLNGDGKVTSIDYLMVKRAFLGTLSLNEAQSCAGRISGGINITAVDYLRIKRHFLGTYNIYGT